MRDRPIVTITGADVRSNGILVGKCLRPPGEKWSKKVTSPVPEGTGFWG